MDASIIKPFISSVDNIMKNVLDLKSSLLPLDLRQSLESDLPIHILIGVDGPLKGIVRYSFCDSFAKNIVELLSEDSAKPETQAGYLHVLKEISCIFFENAISELEAKDVSKTEPNVYLRGKTPKFPPVKTVVIIFNSVIGKVEIGVCLRTIDKNIDRKQKKLA